MLACVVVGKLGLHRVPIPCELPRAGQPVLICSKIPSSLTAPDLSVVILVPPLLSTPRMDKESQVLALNGTVCKYNRGDVRSMLERFLS